MYMHAKMYVHVSAHVYIHRQLGKILRQGFAIIDHQGSCREVMCQGRSTELYLYSWSPVNYTALGKWHNALEPLSQLQRVAFAVLSHREAPNKWQACDICMTLQLSLIFFCCPISSCIKWKNSPMSKDCCEDWVKDSVKQCMMFCRLVFTY